jgi:hypothetical protein
MWYVRVLGMYGRDDDVHHIDIDKITHFCLMLVSIEYRVHRRSVVVAVSVMAMAMAMISNPCERY